MELSAEAHETIRDFVDQARSYEAELGDLEDDDFDRLYRRIIDPLVIAKRDRQARSAQDRDRWEFFNQLEAEADFARWRNRQLAPAQAVALTFGKDPDVVKPERLTPYRRVGGSPFREKFKDRLDLVEAAVAAGDLSIPMSVSALARWALSSGIDLPVALTGREEATPGEDAAFWKAKYEAAQAELEGLRSSIDDLPHKSMVSIYRLIVGMAVARFEHQTEQRTRATSAISEGLRDIKLSLDEETILQHLRAAAKALNYKWTVPILWARSRRPQS